MLKTENNMYSIKNIKKMNNRALFRAEANSKKLLHDYILGAYFGRDGSGYSEEKHAQLFFNHLNVKKECIKRGIYHVQIHN